MRLWHEELIPRLPFQQLLGQHRECCALRGNGWGKKHATVDYVFKHEPGVLVGYHYKIMDEMEKRGFKPNIIWRDPYYRGQNCSPWPCITLDFTSYAHHNRKYLQECLDNLKNKGIYID